VAELEEVEIGEVVLGGQRLVVVLGGEQSLSRLRIVPAGLVAPPEQGQAVADVGPDHERASGVAGALERVHRVAITLQRAVRKVETVPEVALVIEQPRERGAVAGLRQQPAARSGGSMCIVVAAQVHERVHEPDRTATLFEDLARPGVGHGGPPVRGGCVALARETPQDVRSQPPESAASRGIGVPKRGLETLLQPFECRGRFGSAERFYLLQERWHDSELEGGQAEAPGFPAESQRERSLGQPLQDETTGGIGTDEAALAADLDFERPQASIGGAKLAAQAHHAVRFLLHLELHGVGTETVAPAPGFADVAARRARQRRDRGVEQQFRDRVHETACRRGRSGGSEHTDCALMQEVGDLAGAVVAHAGEQLTQLAQAFTTGVTRASEMLFDPAAFAGFQAVFQEVESGARVEVAVPAPVSLQAFLRFTEWWGG
jgi:hypothetical protein